MPMVEAAPTISRPCGWTAATLMPCAGWRIFTASSRQKKLKRLSPRSLPASGAALMISNAACKTTVWHSRQRYWKTRANGRRRQHFSGNDWRWAPAAYGLLTDWQEEAARQSNDGGSSQGFGYTARALLERRVTSNWFVGTAIDIQQVKDYAPSHFLLYVRYSAAGWQGDMDLPPQPLIPYADW